MLECYEFAEAEKPGLANLVEEFLERTEIVLCKS